MRPGPNALCQAYRHAADAALPVLLHLRPQGQCKPLVCGHLSNRSEQRGTCTSPPRAAHSITIPCAAAMRTLALTFATVSASSAGSRLHTACVAPLVTRKVVTPAAWMVASVRCA